MQHKVGKHGHLRARYAANHGGQSRKLQHSVEVGRGSARFLSDRIQPAFDLQLQSNRELQKNMHADSTDVRTADRSWSVDSPFFLENLYERMGQPAWFWPVVMCCIAALWIVASSITYEA